MSLLLIVQFYLLVSVITVTADEENCRLISPCLNVVFPNPESLTEIDDRTSPIPDDNKIADDGHLSGLKPTSYRLNMKFLNLTHYVGSIEISGIVVQNTDRIMLNMKSFYYDGDSVSVRRCWANDSMANGEEVCIRSVGYFARNELLVIDLRGWLIENDRFLITFGNFSSSAFDPATYIGSWGLRIDGEGDFESVSSYFQPGHARSVFPCFDHPSIKASIEFCLEVPTGYSALSTGMRLNQRVQSARNETDQLVTNESDQSVTNESDQSMTNESDQSVTTRTSGSCFLTTPAIAISSFGFAVVSGYMEVDIKGGFPAISIWAPTSRSTSLEWLNESARASLNAMIDLTGMMWPLLRLNVLIVYDQQRFLKNRSVFAGSLGLIVLDGRSLEFSNRSDDNARRYVAYRNVYTGVIRQYIGHTIWIDRWSNVCLQEGLVDYLVLILLRMLRRDVQIDTIAIVTSARRSQYESLIGFDFQDMDSIRSVCSNASIAIYTGLFEQFYGIKINTLERFLFHLTTQFFKSLTIEEWDSKTADSFPDRDLIRGYIKEWFSHPGPLPINATIVDRNLIIAQSSTSASSPPRTVIVQVFNPANFTIRTAVFKDWNHKLELRLNDTPIVIDPEQLTLTRLLYSPELLLNNVRFKVSEEYPAVQVLLVQQSKLKLLDALCSQIQQDLLPLERNVNPEILREILQEIFLLRKKSPFCCCFVTTKEFPECPQEMIATCDRRSSFQSFVANLTRLSSIS